MHLKHPVPSDDAQYNGYYRYYQQNVYKAPGVKADEPNCPAYN